MTSFLRKLLGIGLAITVMIGLAGITGPGAAQAYSRPGLPV